MFVSKVVPLLQSQIQLTVSENRLTLAKSYFTGTAKQKNNSKVCLSRKPVWKFNKWLFLSQCSHNWWSDMVLEFRHRLWFSELIVIRISWGQELKAAGAAAIAPQDAHKWQHKQNPYEVGMIGENCSLLSSPHPRKEKKKRREKWVHLHAFAYSTEAVQSDMLGECVLLYHDRK